MIAAFRARRRRRLLARHPIPAPLWQHTLASLPVLEEAPPADLERLRQLATLFGHEKTFESPTGMALPPELRLRIATLACRPILNLGLDWLDDWRTVIIYPQEFIPELEEMDEAGVVHRWHEPRAGEAWPQGPLILSREDVEASGLGEGYDVVAHEIAHKLDMRNGAVNGFPPLPDSIPARQWSETFSQAFERFCQRLDDGEETLLDAYASHSPGEFFAVTCEYYFDRQDLLAQEMPEVLRLLERFFNPASAAF